MLGLPLYTQYCADHYINTNEAAACPICQALKSLKEEVEAINNLLKEAEIFAASYGLLVGQLDYLQAAEDGQYDKLGWASSSICQ